MEEASGGYGREAGPLVRGRGVGDVVQRWQPWQRRRRSRGGGDDQRGGGRDGGSKQRGGRERQGWRRQAPRPVVRWMIQRGTKG